MRMGIVVSLVMWWLTVFALEMMLTNGTLLDPKVNGALESMMGPSLNNYSGATLFTNGAALFVTIINAIFLWSPTVFAGDLVWLWVLISVPFTVAAIYSIVSMLRGVATG